MLFIWLKIQAFFYHLVSIFTIKRNLFNKQKFKILYLFNFLIWLLLIPLKFLEIFGFSYLLNFIFRLSVKSRQLTKNELENISKVFPDTIKFNHIKINENSKWARIGAKNTKKQHLAFVWMNTINFSRPIDCYSNTSDLNWLTHEMVHIAQFKKLGIQYIFEALLAQKYGGYDYGGKKNLIGHQLNYFNLEQQAEIIKDYVNDLRFNKDVSIYQPYIQDLLKFSF